MAISSKTLLDLMQTVSFRLGDFKADIEDLTNPDTATKNLIECVNEVMRDIWGIKAMPWMYEEDVIKLIAAQPFTAITLTNGSNAVTGITAQSTEIANNTPVAIGGLATNPGIYRGVVSSTTTATLDDAWPHATLNEAGTRGYDRYALPSDFGDFIAGSVMYVSSNEGSNTGVPRKLDVVTPQKLDTHRYRNRSTPLTTGDPQMITLANRDGTSDLWYAEIDPFPAKETTIDANKSAAGNILYRYKKRLTDYSANADTIELPDENMNVLISGIIALWRSYTGGEAHRNDYLQWQGMVLARYAGTDTRSTDSSPSIVPGDVFGSRPTSGNALF